MRMRNLFIFVITLMLLTLIALEHQQHMGRIPL